MEEKRQRERKRGYSISSGGFCLKSGPFTLYVSYSDEAEKVVVVVVEEVEEHWKGK